MTTTIDTAAGEVVVSVIGTPVAVTIDGEVDGTPGDVTYYDVPMRVSLGERTVCGTVSIGDDAHPIGTARDEWIDRGILRLLERLPDYEQREVLLALAAEGGSRVEEFVRTVDA